MGVGYGPLALMMNTGLDPSDALALQRSQIEENVIWARRAKTGTEVAMPISPTLHAALAGPPAHEAETVLANSYGETWTYNGFSTVWHRFKKRLEGNGLISEGLTLKGLRHTVATTLREAGLDERSIADFLGQKTPAMARHYSRSANLAEKNLATMKTLEASTSLAGKASNPSGNASSPIAKRELEDQ